MKPKRLIIIGLDGVPFGMIKKLAKSGVMPNTARLIQDSFFSPMNSTLPEISCVAWSSIITGGNPAEHGIFGFLDLRPHSFEITFPNFNDLKMQPFWNCVNGKSVIINVPATYPVRQMDGVHISGFVSIDINKSVYPSSLIPQLKSFNYRLDVDSQKAHISMDAFLADLDETLTARIKAIELLWDYTDWKIFMPTFTGTDRLMHFLFEAWEDECCKYHDYFLNYFCRVDAAIGDICSKMKDGDALVMLSDHGFEKLEKEIYVNYLLADKGFLSAKPNPNQGSLNIDSATKAFALDPGRIYINQKGKYPAGSVAGEDRESCLQDIIKLFSSLEADGRKVIKHIFRKEDIYQGSYSDNAPDLVLIAEKGFNLKGALTPKELVSKGPFTGKHTYNDAFLLINDKDLAAHMPGEISVIDVGRLIRTIAKEI